MMKTKSYNTMKHPNVLLFVILFSFLASASPVFSGDAWRKHDIKGRRVFFDTDQLPEDYELGNPYVILISMSGLRPILDHKGEPHDHGHIVQLLRDGGNGQIDAPNADGSPGGDDSLAYGTFNHSIVGGEEWPPSAEGKTGLWLTSKFWISYYPDGVYYLRLWEGDDPGTAPYYQDSVEYSTTTGDTGGAMARISPRLFYGPHDIYWKFGKSVERPKK